jgi:Fur family ferric uptake transcriptional regulator
MATHAHPPLDAAAWLREHGFRVTAARLGVVRALERATEPLTLAQLHAKAGKNGCDFATVFRFVGALEEKGLVERMLWVDGSTRHEMSGKEPHAHHHYLICRSCRKVEPLDECVVEQLEKRIARNRGYQELTHSLQLSGVCPKCQK